MTTNVTSTERVPDGECCDSCGALVADVELFGYRALKGWRWFCAEHRLGRWYADQRTRPAAVQLQSSSNNGRK